MAKQAQSSSQFSVPHMTMRPIWVHDSRTAVIHAMIGPICSCVSPRGRPVTRPTSAGRPDTTSAAAARRRRATRCASAKAKTPMSTGTRSSDAPSLVARPSPMTATSDRLTKDGDERSRQRPHGQRVVGAEAAEPAEPVHRRQRVPDRQRVGQRLRAEGQFEQRPPRRAEVAGPEELALHEGEARVGEDLGGEGRRHPPPVQGLEDAGEARELRALRREDPHGDGRPARSR